MTTLVSVISPAAAPRGKAAALAVARKATRGRREAYIFIVARV